MILEKSMDFCQISIRRILHTKVLPILYDELPFSYLISGNYESNSENTFQPVDSDNDFTSDIDRRIDLENFLETLDNESREIMTFVFSEVPDREAANQMNMPKSTYNYKKKKIIERYKNEIFDILTD